MEVDVGIAALGHPGEMAVDALPRLVHLDQQAFGLGLVAIARRRDEPRRIVEQHASLGLDSDMDQHEQVLVGSAEEVLVHDDVVEVDRAGLVEPEPVVEHIARIREQRRLAEPVGNRDHRSGEIGREVFWRFGLTPDIGLHEE